MFDIGGHSFHTPHPDVRDFVLESLGLEFEAQVRRAWVYFGGALIPYPFQKHFHLLPSPTIAAECARGLRHSSPHGRPKDLTDWIVSRFGPGISKHFMLPHNRKLWARDLSRISADWVTERVAGPQNVREHFAETGGKRTPLQSDTTVYYPSKGGFGRIFEAIACKVPHRIAYNHEVVGIDLQRRVVLTSTGRWLRYRHLVTTMPVDRFLQIATPVPSEVASLARALEVMSLFVVRILARRRLSDRIHRIYCAEPWFPPHKTALNHNSSTDLRRRPVHAVVAEVSFSPEKPVDRASLVDVTTAGLVAMGIIDSPADVAWSSILRVEHAYPVQTHGRARLMERIREYLSRYDVLTAGRFGGWEYKNSDACLNEGLQIGRSLETAGPLRCER